MHKFTKKKRHEEFHQQLSMKILNPRAAIAKIVEIPHFSKIFNEIINFSSEMGICTKEILREMRTYFSLFIKLQEQVSNKTSSTCIQFIFLTFFIMGYGALLGTQFPFIQAKLIPIALYNLISIFILITCAYFLNRKMFANLWLLLRVFMLTEMRMQAQMSIKKTLSASIEVVSKRRDNKEESLRLHFMNLLTSYREVGEDVRDEITMLLDELEFLISSRTLKFEAYMKFIKILALGVCFLPSLFYLNLLMMRHSLGQIL